jgi:hypothetical protein
MKLITGLGIEPESLMKAGRHSRVLDYYLT